MNTYLFSYLDGIEDHVQADRVEYDCDDRTVTAILSDNVVYLAPISNIRSVRRQPSKP
ncbi:hypothetical protein ACFYOY_13265 [Streptomyces sp. NPDC007875]|uniref:hypothetical protein n=1 Tax=Streptomyces sp. NPDC007875 TaxID=3364783 RepID=UPI00368E3BE2